jgi:hypothetical protein
MYKYHMYDLTRYETAIEANSCGQLYAVPNLDENSTYDEIDLAVAATRQTCNVLGKPGFVEIIACRDGGIDEVTAKFFIKHVKEGMK